MIQTIEAVVDINGCVRLLGKVELTGPRRALLTILEEPAETPGVMPGEAALLSEAALSDWNRAEEDEAWSHLQSEK